MKETTMGKIIIEFDSVEESQDARTALDGYKWKMAMWDLDQELRRTVKYSKPLLSDDGQASEMEMDIADKIREKIREILDGHGITLID
jgi:hypothetical protein